MAYLPTGAKIYELKNGGIEYLVGGRVIIGSHSNEDTPPGAGGGYWAGNCYQFLSKLKQEGKYRVKFRAGAFAGKGRFALENVKLLFEFGKFGDKASLDTATIIVDAPLDHPKDYVVDMYLHAKPESNIPNTAHLSWNGAQVEASEKING